MLRQRTVSKPKVKGPSQIQNIRLNITHANQPKIAKGTSPAPVIQKKSPVVQKQSPLHPEKLQVPKRNSSKSKDKSTEKGKSKGKVSTPSPTVSKGTLSTVGKESKGQLKGKSIRQVRLMNTRTSLKGTSTSKRSLSKKQKQKTEDKNLKVSNKTESSLMQKIEVSSFNQNCQSMISINSKTNNFEDNFEVQSILKYIPPLQSPSPQLSLQQFEIISSCTQQGSYFTDSLALHKITGMIFILRTISKEQVFMQEREKELIQAIKIQFFVSAKDFCNMTKIYAIFYDSQSIFLVLEPNHSSFTVNLWNEAQLKEGLKQQQTSIGIKELSQTIHSLHSESILLRTINLQGLRMNFGVLKIDRFDQAAWMGNKIRRNSFCGDIQTIAPELASGSFYDLSYDMWQVGLVLYSLSTGLRPFIGEQALESIRNLQFGIPFSLSKQIGTLIDKLLTKKEDRMEVEQLLRDPFLKKSKQLINRQIWSFWEEKGLSLK